MFRYVDHLFASARASPRVPYRKLALHFVVNDLAMAEQSVGSRMALEMAAGAAATGGTAKEVRPDCFPPPLFYYGNVHRMMFVFVRAMSGVDGLRFPSFLF